VTLRTRRPRLELLEGRDAPATLTVGYSPVTHTLTVVGTDADNQLTITGDAADATHFTLSSTTDTFAGGGTTFASPSGVQSIAVRMLGGDDTVFLSNSPPIRLAGGLSIDGGDGANSATAFDLTVGKNLTIRNGTNAAGTDRTNLFDLNVNGSLTVTNGDGDTLTQVLRNSAGVSAVRGAVNITNGTGLDYNFLDDLNVGGNVTVRNGHADAAGNAGGTEMENIHNTSARSQFRGSVAVSYLDGATTFEGVFDAEVGGNVAFSYGSGGGNLYFDGNHTGVPLLVHGSVSVTGTGAKVVSTKYSSGLGAIIGKNLTVTGGAAADTVTLTRATVNGTTTLNLGAGDNTVTVDDSLFVGPFRLTTGGGADTIKLETATGTGTGTTFVRAVTMALGAGVDSLTLGGSNDANQALVFAGSFVVHHGADGESPTTFGKDVYPFGGGLQWVV
jgi:hypothetical protein